MAGIMVSNGVNALQTNGIDPIAARAQVDRILASKTFEASDVHRRLLHFLSEKTLSGEADRLKEYTIGLEAFGKPESYDPKQDSIVRLQVGRLRQKLAVYYQSEASGDPIVVTVPKGAFKIAFEPYGAERVVEPPPARSRWMAVALALVAAWGLAATGFAVRASRQVAGAERWSPELEALCQPFLDSKRSLLVCLGTPLFVRFPNLGF